jgi:hypothetical protein
LSACIYATWAALCVNVDIDIRIGLQHVACRIFTLQEAR